MRAPSVSQVMVTVCSPVKEPPFGSMTGAAAGSAFVNVAVTISLAGQPSLTAMALTVADSVSVNAPV